MAAFYGQIVLGAPGAGKSTYCNALTQLFTSMGRDFIHINLDPANDFTGNVDVDIKNLITVSDVMNKLSLGPNGALRYCMQTLANNLSWLFNELEDRKGYLIIDMPGQLELYNSDDSVRKIVDELTKKGFRLCAVHLSDSMHCSDVGKFVAVIFSALSIMINLEIAQINVLSKSDLLQENLPFDLSFFEELPDLRYLTDRLEDHPALAKYKGLCEKLAEVIEGYNLVSFVPLDVMNKEKMVKLVKLADTANGFGMIESEDIRNIVIK